MPLVLSHLTLNTGHLAHTVRADVADKAVTMLLSVLDAGGGAVPGMPGWFLDVMFPLGSNGAKLDGGAFLQIAAEPGASTRPVAMAVAVWCRDLAANAWEQAMVGYWAQQRPLSCIDLWRDPPARPPPLPWLAAWLTPFVDLADAATLQTFDDLERCIVWALIP